MPNPKYILEQIKIEGELKELLFKAESVVVTYNGEETTLAAVIADIYGDLANVPTTAAMNSAIATAISQSGHAHFEKVDAVPAVADAQENVMYLVKNNKTHHYDIYAKVAGDTEGSYTMELLDDTTVDLTGLVEKVEGATAGNIATLTAEGGIADSGKKPADFVEKETGKRLMTDEEGSKLGGIASGATKVEASENNGYIKVNDQETKVYEHPADAESAKAAAFRKVGRDAEGHVVVGADITKEDITGLGIPGQDTTYSEATASAAGLMPAADKARMDAAGAVWTGDSAPAAMRNGDLFVRVVNPTQA